MTRMRIAGVLAAGLWVALWAAGPAAADGLARFEKSIKSQVPPDTLSYKSAKALGDSGFELRDVVVTPPPSDPAKKPDPIAIKAITVEDLDFDSIEKQQPPLYAKLRIEGISTGANPGGAVDLKQMTGLDTVSADFQLDYKLAPDKKTFTLSRLELNLNGLGRLETSMVLDGVSPDLVGQPNAALQDASLRTASLVYDDHSLLAKALPIVAVMQGSDPKALIATATTFLDAARAGQSEAAQKAIDSLVAFVEDYAKPKGPLRIALNPPNKVSNADFEKAKTADDLVKLLGVEVSYAGQRSSSPAAPAAAAAKKPAPDAGSSDDDDDDDSKPLNKKK